MASMTLDSVAYGLIFIRACLCLYYLFAGWKVRRALAEDIQKRKVSGVNGMLSLINENELTIERKRLAILSLIFLQTCISLSFGLRDGQPWPILVAIGLYLVIVFLVGSPSADKVRLHHELIREAKALLAKAGKK